MLFFGLCSLRLWQNEYLSAHISNIMFAIEASKIVIPWGATVIFRGNFMLLPKPPPHPLQKFVRTRLENADHFSCIAFGVSILTLYSIRRRAIPYAVQSFIEIEWYFWSQTPKQLQRLVPRLKYAINPLKPLPSTHDYMNGKRPSSREVVKA